MPVHAWSVCFGYRDDVNVDAEELPSLMVLFRIWVFKERWLIFMHMYATCKKSNDEEDDCYFYFMIRLAVTAQPSLD